MKIFRSFLDEMAAPTQEHREKLWYHGCSGKNIQEILSTKVLKPGNTADIKSLKMYTPLYNRVYLTPMIKFALVYAFGGHLSNETPRNQDSYLCVVKGQNLNDIVPDEDIIADIMHLITYDRTKQSAIISQDYLERQAKEKNWSTQEIDFIKSLLRYIIFNMTPTQQINAVRMDYGHGTKIGKQLIKKMSNEMKIDIINKTVGHKSIAVEGEIPIYEIWKLNTKDYSRIKEQPSEFKKYAQQLL